MASEPLDFSPDGHLLLQSSLAGEIRLINADTGSQMGTYPFDPSENEITSPSPDLRAISACFSADGHRILVLDGNPARPDIPCFLRMIDVRTGRKLRSFRSPVGTYGQIAFSPDDQSVLLAGNNLILCKLP
jgi:WD40 repeat protein